MQLNVFFSSLTPSPRTKRNIQFSCHIDIFRVLKLSGKIKWHLNFSFPFYLNARCLMRLSSTVVCICSWENTMHWCKPSDAMSKQYEKYIFRSWMFVYASHVLASDHVQWFKLHVHTVFSGSKTAKRLPCLGLSLHVAVRAHPTLAQSVKLRNYRAQSFFSSVSFVKMHWHRTLLLTIFPLCRVICVCVLFDWSKQH